jgi:lysophospholipase L1-like esterase
MSRMSTLLNNTIPSSFGLIPPGVDNRWTLGSGWSATTFGIGILACYTTAPSANALVCTDARTAWDRCDVYVMRGSGIGTLTATATGGSGVPINCNQGSSDITKITCSAASLSASNTVSIICSVSNAYVVGVEFWNSTVPRIRVGNGGVGTVGAQQHVMLATSWGSIPFLAAYQADLVIIGLGLNDRGAGRTPAQFKADMQTLITAAKLNSDVIVCSEMPAQSAPQATNEAAYNTILGDLSNENSIPYYAYAERCQSFTAYNALGLAFDGLHQNNLGYWDWAQGIVPALLSI